MSTRRIFFLHYKANLLVLFFLAFTLQASDGIELSGDVLRIAMPVAACGLTLLKQDKTGLFQCTGSLATTMAITYGLKLMVDKPRPNGKPYSFPSGHSSICFSSATFLAQRYKTWQYWVPAYALAVFTGYSRVESHNHYIDDVLAGAFIGLVVTTQLTKPFHDKFEIEPSYDGEQVGLKISRFW